MLDELTIIQNFFLCSEKGTFWGVPQVTCYKIGYTHDVNITTAPHTEILYNGDVSMFEWNIIEGRTVCFY